MKTAQKLLAAASAVLILSSACAPRPGQPKGQGKTAPTSQAADTTPEAKGTDPRAAYESSGQLGGIVARIESPIALVAASGEPEAGVSLALGASLSSAAIARRTFHQGQKTSVHELVLASGAALSSLPGPVLAMASSGERILVSSSTSSGGELLCFKAEGEGERLVEAWKKEGFEADRLIAVPGDRVAASIEGKSSPRLCLIDSSSGSELWSQDLQDAAADIAYAPGLILAASGAALSAYDESTGTVAWSASLTARASAVSAGGGIAVVLARTGSLSAFSLADGKGEGASPGPYDPRLRAVIDGSRAIAAFRQGGAEELDLKTGKSLRRWSWTGPSSFIAANEGRLFAGIEGKDGKGLFIASRSGAEGDDFVKLPASAFDLPLAVGGSRGGLLLLLQDGSLVLVGKAAHEDSAASAFEAAIAPSSETAAAIGTALGRFKGSDGIGSGKYLRFDLFVQGVPLDTGVAFTAFRYESPASAKREFSAQPPSQGAVIAIYDEGGRELGSSVDELGATSKATAYLEKGKRYWIVGGWSYQAESASFRLFAK